MKNNALLKYYQMMGSKPPKPTGYIQFEDPEVERICIANFSSDGIGVSYEDAEKVTNLKGKFAYNNSITKFNELKFFTGLTELKPFGGNGVFEGCGNLKIVTIPKNVVFLGDWLFLRSGVNKIIMLPETPPEVGKDRVLPGGAGFSLYVPDELLGKYKTDTIWGNFGKRTYPLSTYVEPTNN